jgi:hypothetical protein
MSVVESKVSVIAVLGAALAVAGVLAAISYGSDQRRQAGVVELVSAGCEGAAACETFPLGTAEAGMVAASSVPVKDVDGRSVGRVRCACTVARGVGWLCAMVASISPGRSTERGTITASGVFRPLSEKGEVNTYAITGGTGRYLGATGYVTEGWDRRRGAFVFTLHVASA